MGEEGAIVGSMREEVAAAGSVEEEDAARPFGEGGGGEAPCRYAMRQEGVE